MRSILLLYLMASAYSVFCQNGSLTLEIKGIVGAKGGELSAGIFKEENFPKVGKQFIGAVKNVDGNEAIISFDQVPEGEYGIAVFQDINKDKELKTNFVGLPLEPIGFSNDARIRFGPPSFESARIVIEKGKNKRIVISLR